MKTKLVSIILLASLIAMATISVHTVNAQSASQEQELEQSSTVECVTTGAYGQGQTCNVTTNQRGRQRQEIVFNRNGQVLAAHQVANTALDAQTMALVAGLATLGAASAVGFVKTKNV
jgi:hypothetical protein